MVQGGNEHADTARTITLRAAQTGEGVDSVEGFYVDPTPKLSRSQLNTEDWPLHEEVPHEDQRTQGSAVKCQECKKPSPRLCCPKAGQRG